MISHSKKFIFIHIYKTAGTSISAKLFPYARFIERFSGYYPTSILVKIFNYSFNLNDNGNKWINGVHKHAKAIEIKKYLGQKKFEDYFKFSFVRHPMDWQVSLYEYIKNTPHRNHNLVKEMSFKEFVLMEINNKSPRQIDFLSENNNFIVDKIYKFENFNEEVKKLFKSLNINLKQSTLNHLNRSPRDKNYNNYYDSDLIKIVRDYYSDDFKLLGYK